MRVVGLGRDRMIGGVGAVGVLWQLLAVAHQDPVALLVLEAGHPIEATGGEKTIAHGLFGMLKDAVPIAFWQGQDPLRIGE